LTAHNLSQLHERGIELSLQLDESHLRITSDFLVGR
jgi:hypothetical protein